MKAGTNFSSYLDGVVSPDDQQHIFPIKYLHDPLASHKPTHHPTPLPFPSSTPSQPPYANPHAITLTPLSGTLPYHSSIPHVYQSKYWRASLEASRTTTYLLSIDANMADMPVRGGVTLQALAKKELSAGFRHRSMRASVYMYPFSVSAERLEIISVLNMLLFLFDDKFESATSPEMAPIITSFLQSLKPEDEPSGTPSKSNGNTPTQTPFQAYIASMITSTRTLDSSSFNTAGAEMFSEVLKLFDDIPTPTFNLTLDSYLEFRRKQLQSSWVFASVKFGLSSNVDIHQPKISAFMMWAAEHGALVNDLYSYEKEMIALRKGMIRDMVSAVPVVGRIEGLADEGSCLERVRGMVREREEWMAAELGRWEVKRREGKGVKEGALDDETWMFLRAVWACVAGNTMFCTTSVRYGGEKARVC